jgi:hypothetical protein
VTTLNNDEAAVAAQAMMNAASGERGWRDPMAPFRDLIQAQRDALRGDPDDIFCVETQPF